MWYDFGNGSGSWISDDSVTIWKDDFRTILSEICCAINERQSLKSCGRAESYAGQFLTPWPVRYDNKHMTLMTFPSPEDFSFPFPAVCPTDFWGDLELSSSMKNWPIYPLKHILITAQLAVKNLAIGVQSIPHYAMGDDPVGYFVPDNEQVFFYKSSGTQDDIQEVRIASSYLTGGSFTLSFRGQTTDPIAYNSSVDDLRAKLEALSTIGIGGCSVTKDSYTYSGSISITFRIQFTNQLGNQSIELLQGDSTGLVPGPYPLSFEIWPAYAGYNEWLEMGGFGRTWFAYDTHMPQTYGTGSAQFPPPPYIKVEWFDTRPWIQLKNLLTNMTKIRWTFQPLLHETNPALYGRGLFPILKNNDPQQPSRFTARFKTAGCTGVFLDSRVGFICAASNYSGGSTTPGYASFTVDGRTVTLQNREEARVPVTFTPGMDKTIQVGYLDWSPQMPYEGYNDYLNYCYIVIPSGATTYYGPSNALGGGVSYASASPSNPRPAVGNTYIVSDVSSLLTYK